MDFFLTFFERAYNDWMARDGYGRTSTGEVIRDWERETATRRACVMETLTVLQEPGAVPGGTNARHWALLTRFWNFFCQEENDVSIVENIPNSGYRIGARTVRLPGAIYMPRAGDGGEWTPLQRVLNRVHPLGEAYQEVFYSGRDRKQPASTREAVSHTLAVVNRYIVGFSQFFHSTYCAIYRLAALHPELWFDCMDPGNAWRSTFGVRENPEYLEQLHLMTAAYAKPHRALFPQHPTLAPLTPNQGLTAFTRLVAVGCVYRAGMRDVEQTIDIEFYVELWNSNNAEECVKEYEQSLLLGRQMMEVLGIIAGISVGTLIEMPTLREFIVRALSRGVLNTKSTVALMRAFGIAPNGATAVRELDVVEYRTLHEDPRVYRLEYGTVTPNDEFATVGGRNIDYIRPSVKKNLDLLCKAFFGDEYGMVRISRGMVYSQRFLRGLTFQDSHMLSPVSVYMGTSPRTVHSDIKDQVQDFFPAHIRYKYWDINVVLQERHAEVIARHPTELLELAQREFGCSVPFVTFIVDRPCALNERVIDFMEDAVALRIGVVCFPRTRFIYNHAILQVSNVSGEFARDVDMYVALLNSIRLRYMDILSRRQDVVLLEWVMKVHRENVTYSHMFTFPSGREYTEGYVTAFMISADLRFLVYKHLLENVNSRMGFVDLITPAHCLNGFSLPLDAMQKASGILGTLIATWMRCFAVFTKETLAHTIVQDLLAPFIDVQVERRQFGSPETTKAVLFAIGIKVSLVMSPNVYGYNKHAKARMLMDFVFGWNME